MFALIVFNWLAPLLIGACVGSFLNVCIYRWPLNQSVSHPGSRCACCGTPIPWFHNIPVFAWVWLRGKAACCGGRVDCRYAVVELVCALLAITLWNMPGATIGSATVRFLASCVLLYIAYVDLNHGKTSGRAIWVLAGLGILGAIIFTETLWCERRLYALWQAGGGALAGGCAGGLAMLSFHRMKNLSNQTIIYLPAAAGTLLGPAGASVVAAVAALCVGWGQAHAKRPLSFSLLVAWGTIAWWLVQSGRWWW